MSNHLNSPPVPSEQMSSTTLQASDTFRQPPTPVQILLEPSKVNDGPLGEQHVARVSERAEGLGYDGGVDPATLAIAITDPGRLRDIALHDATHGYNPTSPITDEEIRLKKRANRVAAIVGTVGGLAAATFAFLAIGSAKYELGFGHTEGGLLPNNAAQLAPDRIGISYTPTEGQKAQGLKSDNVPGEIVALSGGLPTGWAVGSLTSVVLNWPSKLRVRAKKETDAHRTLKSTKRR